MWVQQHLKKLHGLARYAHHSKQLDAHASFGSAETTCKINVPVRLNSEDQDTTICPGDILIGDINGVVCIPQALAEKAVDLIQSQVDADEKVAKDIRRGRTVTESMKEHRAGVRQP